MKRDEFTMSGDAAFQLAMRLDDVISAANAMAQAWRDLFNDVGNIPEVRKAFESVERHVSEWEG